MYPDYYYDYGFSEGITSADMGSAISTLLIIYLVVYLIAFAYSILVYILQSLGMYTVANRRGIHHPWLAWIPIGNVWILGSISDQYQYVAKGRVRSRRKVLLGLTIATYGLLIPFIISYVAFLIGAMDAAFSGNDLGADAMGSVLIMLGVCLVMMVVSIIATVFMYIAYYDLFASCDPNNAVMFLVLSIFFSFLLPYFVFACRKKDKGMPPRKAPMPTPTWQPAPPPPAPAWQQPLEPAEPVMEPVVIPDEEPAPAENVWEVTEEDFADETEE